MNSKTAIHYVLPIISLLAAMSLMGLKRLNDTGNLELSAQSAQLPAFSLQ